MLYTNEMVYDHSNIHKLVSPTYSEKLADGRVANVQVVNGHKRYLSGYPKPSGHDSRKYSKPFNEAAPVIPRHDWSAALAEQVAQKRCISQRQPWEPDDQDGYPICWAAGTCAAFSTARVFQGLPFIRISGMSVAVPISGGHSGGYEGDAVEYLTKYGGASVDVWPYDDPGRSYQAQQAVVESRKHHLALEAYECNSFDEFATALLLGFPCTVDWPWWSHVTMLCDLVEIEAGSFGVRIRNNWGDWGAKNDFGFSGYEVFREGHGTPGGGFAFRQVLASIA
jgi:hypothetical protein